MWRNTGEQIHGVTPSKIDAAKSFINGLTSAGGTNIYDSLTQVVGTTRREMGIHAENFHYTLYCFFEE